MVDPEQLLQSSKDMLFGDFVHFPRIPWLSGIHDGYPLCSTLGEYTRSRRTRRFSRSNDAALWQSAMTFGLLEALMNVKIPESSFLSVSDAGDKSFTSDAMSVLVFDWLYRFVSLERRDPPSAAQWAERILAVLTRASSALAEDCLAARSTLERGGLSPDDSEWILCVIGTLLEALSDCALVAGIITESPFGTFTKSLLTDTYLDRLVADGWCPFTIHKLVPRTLSLLAYVSTRSLPIRELKDEHDRCDPDACMFYQVDEKTYENSHVCPHRPCEYLAPPSHDVFAYLERGEIPVVTLDQDSQHMTVRGASGGSYVAISHVWADGLGSTTEKGLPACQVARIVAMTRRLVSGGTFWMDALCVPTVHQMRKRAIMLMADTYRRADVVLVIDAGISSCSPSMSAMDKLLRVKTSGWMQRLWTLQEGMLARKLVFQVSDDLVEASSLARALMEEGLNLSRAPGLAITPPYARGFLESMAFLTQPATERSRHSLGEVVGYLEGRATTKAVDETVAISGLVDVDAGELVALKSVEERMKKFLLLVGQVPRGLPFASSDKLPFEGFRWAPRSLAAIGKLETEPGELACVTEAGLQGEYTIIHFAEKSVELEHEHNGMKFRVQGDLNKSVYTMVLDHDFSPVLRFNAILLHGTALPVSSGSAGNCATVSVAEDGKQSGPGRGVTSEVLVCDYAGSASVTNLGNDHDTSIVMNCGVQIRGRVLLK